MNTTKSMVMEALRSRYIAREREDTVEFLTAVESGTPVNIDKLDWLIRRIMVAATAREVVESLSQGTAGEPLDPIFSDDEVVVVAGKDEDDQEKTEEVKE